MEVSLLAFTLAFFALLLLRYNLERLQRRVDAIGVRAAMRGTSTNSEQAFR